MSNFTPEARLASVPHYPWGTNYHIDGAGATQGTYLEEILIPSLDQLPHGALVADFGSGDGRLRAKSPIVRHYIYRAYDVAPEAVNKYNAAVTRHNRESKLFLHDSAEVADLIGLDVGQERFHAAFSWRVLHGTPTRLPNQYGEEDIHVRILRQTSRSLKPGALYHVAVRSERDWVAGELRKQGVYLPGRRNNCYDVMKEAFRDQPAVPDWNLYFFAKGELIEKGRRAGLEVAFEVPIEEESGFLELRKRGPLSYDYVAFYKEV